MEALWQLTAEAVREAIAKAQIRPAEIACVACTGHGNGLYLVDQAGRPVRPAIRGADTRARAYIDRWLADGVDRAIRPKTMQAIWPAQPNALLAWMRDHEPQSLQRAAANLTCKDYIRLRLTGEIYQERTDMSGCSLIERRHGRLRHGGAGGVRDRRHAPAPAAAQTLRRSLRVGNARRRGRDRIDGRHARGRRACSTSTPVGWLPEWSTKRSCA